MARPISYSPQFPDSLESLRRYAIPHPRAALRPVCHEALSVSRLSKCTVSDRRALAPVASLAVTCRMFLGSQAETCRGVRRYRLALASALERAQLLHPRVQALAHSRISANKPAHPWRCGRSARNYPRVWSSSSPVLFVSKPAKRSRIREFQIQASSSGWFAHLLCAL